MTDINSIIETVILSKSETSKLCQIALYYAVKLKKSDKIELFENELKGYDDDEMQLPPHRQKYKDKKCARASIMALERRGNSVEAINIISSLNSLICAWFGELNSKEKINSETINSFLAVMKKEGELDDL